MEVSTVMYENVKVMAAHERERGQHRLHTERLTEAYLSHLFPMEMISSLFDICLGYLKFQADILHEKCQSAFPDEDLLFEQQHIFTICFHTVKRIKCFLGKYLASCDEVSRHTIIQRAMQKITVGKVGNAIGLLQDIMTIKDDETAANHILRVVETLDERRSEKEESKEARETDDHRKIWFFADVQYDAEKDSVHHKSINHFHRRLVVISPNLVLRIFKDSHEAPERCPVMHNCPLYKLDEEETIDGGKH